MPRERVPRQSIPSSGGAASSNGTLDTTAVQTSGLTAATSSSSALATSSTSESSSPSADPTTTSTLAESTSTPQTTSQTSSAVSSTSSQASSSSSTPSSTTPPTASSSSPAPPPGTTQPAIPSSSQQGTPTIITSAYTTYVNGSQILTQTTIPSTIPQPSTSPSSSERTAIIAGSAAGGTALLILLLSLAFCARRKRFKRLDFLHAITLKRKQERSRATLLDGEDLDDVDLARPPRRYTDYDTPWDARETGARRTPGAPPPSGARWSETGSAFRDDLPHEGTRLMDPLANRDDLDLGRIVDDVMGPSHAAGHFSDRSVSSVYRDSVAESEGVVHSRTVSNASNAALLEAAGMGAPSTAPVRSSPLAQSGARPEHPTGGVS